VAPTTRQLGLGPGTLAALGYEPPAPAAGYTVTVRGLVLMCSIGIRRREREQRQRVRVSVDLIATAAAAVPGDDRRRVINYEKVVAAIREIARSGHIDLCEGFANGSARRALPTLGSSGCVSGSRSSTYFRMRKASARCWSGPGPSQAPAIAPHNARAWRVSATS